MRAPMFAAAAALAAVLVGWPAAAAPDDPGKAAPPQVTGEWVGTWGPYSPDGAKKAPYPSARLDCKVAPLPDGKFQAIFSGEAGRAYKYTIQVPGRAVGPVVLFQGTVDLGAKDGGVYDWIGRATDKEFVGFYTSQSHAGHFRLTRPPTN